MNMTRIMDHEITNTSIPEIDLMDASLFNKLPSEAKIVVPSLVSAVWPDSYERLCVVYNSRLDILGTVLIIVDRKTKKITKEKFDRI